MSNSGNANSFSKGCEARSRAAELDEALAVLSKYDEGPDLVLYYKHLMVLEGNPDHARRISEHLSNSGGDAVEVETRNDLASGLVRIGVGGLDAILSNVRLPDCAEGCISRIVVEKSDQVSIFK